MLFQQEYVPENLDSVAEFEAPQSPESSYSQTFPGDEDFAKDPMAVPPQLHLSVLDSENSDETASSSTPQHVVLNHLFIEKGWSSQSMVALGMTHRYQSKYVTVVLYKPLKRWTSYECDKLLFQHFFLDMALLLMEVLDNLFVYKFQAFWFKYNSLWLSHFQFILSLAETFNM